MYSRMASFSPIVALVVLLCTTLLITPSSANHAPTRKLALVQTQPLVLNYHKGPLLTGHFTVNLIWYGKFTPTQRSIIADFIRSLSPNTKPLKKPSVSTWWNTTAAYNMAGGGGAPSTLTLGHQYIDDHYSLGKLLSPSHLLTLSSKLPHRGSINLVLTASDVAFAKFCMSSCGLHSSGLAGKHRKSRFVYGWVGNPATQCPGQCAWPFHQPMFGPQTPPLVAPNADVGIDGMIINIATILAGATTNPYNTGYFQGPPSAPLEAVSACTGIFGSGAFPGYPGKVLVDMTSGASYNVHGLSGRKYLLPAMWDPNTRSCKTLL